METKGKQEKLDLIRCDPGAGLWSHSICCGLEYI